MNSSVNPPNNRTHPLFPDWQRDMVLIAKNTPVWLAQLSKEYLREIKTLDQIPEEELDKLRNYGITGLWLVGVWQRSSASKRIKQLYGHDQLIASAYSILDYKISEDLGGESALNDLKTKASKKGIYLACDMVPNHTAIDSPWLSKHPEWYIHTSVKPVDTWEFDSPDLSTDPSVAIHLEDGYYKQTRAAEVFQYKAKSSRNPLYIYHGNDGTSMPWNDTAQLDYLNPETRQAMKSRIIEVARKFSIVRMDAAMTLLRQHFKRLWYPDSGADKNIPTRIGNIMTQAEFDALMPNEFWGEVIQDLSREAPDTFILAEAFWMMEKFFVQSLGMHRVYNSAFLNHLRNEENNKFRKYMIEILGSDHFMLDSFVNYLTTPDEQPAVLSFGKGKKYFGVCGLMACLPGLPLFGHGQFVGFSEQYGMDFARPYHDETADLQFTNDHYRLITPLLNLRQRFSSSENLKIFNFINESSILDTNVYVFTNEVNSLRSLIVFNNQNKEVAGRINKSANIPKSTPSDLVQALQINGQDHVLLKEIRFGDEQNISYEKLKENGLEISLQPYDFFVYDVN
jgi:hypothetical protein